MAKEARASIGLDPITAGLAIVAIVFVWSAGSGVLEKLGLKESAEDKAADQVNNQSVDASFWSPLYWKQLYAKNPRIIYLSAAQAYALAARIYNAWGTFNDDEEAIYAVFRSIPSKFQISQVAAAYNAQYQVDLVQRLKSGLSKSELAVISKIVTPLPNYTVK